MFANQLYSIHHQLFYFHVILQNWGMKYHAEKNMLYYEYTVAFDNQRLLFDEIQQVLQVLVNLQEILSLQHQDQNIALLR